MTTVTRADRVARHDAEAPTDPVATSARPHRSRFRQWRATVAVLVTGLVLTGVLAFGARAVHDHNEDRLLAQRTREAGAVLTAAVSTVQAPLLAGAIIAENTDGDSAAFQRLMKPITTKGQPFASASLWSVRSPARRPIVTVGAPQLLAAEPAAQVHRLFESAVDAPSFIVESYLSAPVRRLGYAITVPSKSARYVVYAESAALPKNRRAIVERDSAFADLDYALYVGRRVDPRAILASSTGGALKGGRHAAATVPFGSSQLHIVMAPRTELGGTLLARLPWLFAIFGVALTVGAAAMVDRISRGRARAESLARENSRLYDEQRSVAQTLQRSLLPQTMPEIPGCEVATKYVAGVHGIEVGGDWYDLVALDDRRLLFVVGDVSGRGLHAATVMASLRYAMRAYALDGDGPAQILSKLTRLLHIGSDNHFATVVCGVIDLDDRRLVLANAGHPDPILIDGKHSAFVESQRSVPVGVEHDFDYPEVTVALPPRGTLVAYTDGLMERRGESLDLGLQRLLDASAEDDRDVTALIERLVATGGVSTDDTAILAVRWDESA